ncbi:MAG: alkaline phosphatase family protein, partial [Haloferula sp.]
MQRLAVINLVGLSSGLLGKSMPRLTAFSERVGLQTYRPAFPAVTCTAQSSIVTGTCPREHGIVANGWYDREAAEVKFWKQSNHLVHGEKIWDALKRENPDFTCAKLFWWYNMYSSADYSMTPRPLYPADGRKVFDIHTHPMDWREQVKADLGEFPFPSFWGPGAGIGCSKWIAGAAKWTEEKVSPTLSLVYLPHLDYGLQKWGPDAVEMEEELRGIDEVAGDLIDYYESRNVRVMVLSEYGISPVSKPSPVRPMRSRSAVRPSPTPLRPAIRSPTSLPPSQVSWTPTRATRLGPTTRCFASSTEPVWLRSRSTRSSTG